jgi:peptidoglycan L-alanyl-D-glutamate endopeptidase CwlK
LFAPYFEGFAPRLPSQNTLDPISDDPVIDSAMTWQEALRGRAIPHAIQSTLVLLDVEYRGFDAWLHRGQIIVHHELSEDVTAIFFELCAMRFPIEKVIPVARYGWSDDASMADNNSSGFNYRLAVGLPHLSQHALGRAIDINPCLNPYLKGALILPPNAVYDCSRPGTLCANDLAVEAFTTRGWTWGGDWTHLKDWQHFEKRAR